MDSSIPRTQFHNATREDSRLLAPSKVSPRPPYQADSENTASSYKNHRNDGAKTWTISGRSVR